jgi:hypothetical protein
MKEEKNKAAKPSSDELFQSIVDNIKQRYNGELSDVEAHTAARNLIEFVRIVLKHYEQKN